MKLALCLEYPIDQHGGTEVLVRELILGLSANHQVLLVSADDPAGFARSSVAGSVGEHIQWMPQAISSAYSRQLARQLAATRPDLVHFHLGENHAWKCLRPWKSPLVAAARTGLPVLATNHGAFSIFSGCCPDDYPPVAKLTCLPPAWIGKLITLARLRAEVAVSQHDWRALRRWYRPQAGRFRWIYHSRLRGAPPPFNPTILCPSPPSKPPSSPGELEWRGGWRGERDEHFRRKTILCAGTLSPRKGQPLLVEAFGKIAHTFPDWQLVLIGREGEPAILRQIRELVAQRQIEEQVQFLGPCTDAELREWLEQSAIFAMPSVYEGLGLSLQEAQFCGCACVATRCGGPVDLIADGQNGLLVPVGAAAELAGALQRLMSDPELRERFSRRGPKSVLEKGMTAEKMVAAYERVYAEIIHRSDKPVS